MPHTPLRVAFRRPWPGTLRGLVLWWFSIAFILIGGINFLGTTPPEPTRTYLSLALYYTHGHAAPLGVMFVGVGLAAGFSSYCHFNRDRFGYVLACVMAFGWGAVYVSGWLFFDASVRAVGAGLTWVLFGAVLATCARIPRVPLDFAKRIGDD